MYVNLLIIKYFTCFKIKNLNQLIVKSITDRIDGERVFRRGKSFNFGRLLEGFLNVERDVIFCLILSTEIVDNI